MFHKNFRIKKQNLLDFTEEQIKYLSILGWLSITIYLSFLIFLKAHPNDITVTFNYWDAAKAWLNSEYLNKVGGQAYSGGFVYLPQSAILQIPFALIPPRLAQFIWLIINVILLSFSCNLLVKISNRIISNQNIKFFIISLITIPLAYDSLRNGQINTLLTVFFIFIAYNLAHKRFKLCVFFCIIGIALKIYTIVPLLLLLGLYPRKMTLPTIVGIIILFLFPFLCQYPIYVLEQYKNSYFVLLYAGEAGITSAYSGIYGLLSIFGYTLPKAIVFTISLVAAFIIYLNCLLFFKKITSLNSVIVIFQTVVFCLLFNTKTEYNTYVFTGPFMGYFIFISLFSSNSFAKWIYIATSIVCWFFIFSASAISKLLTQNINLQDCTWTAPLAYSIFVIFTFIFFIIKQRKNINLQNKTYKNN